MELLRWACALGATALNYVQAEDLLQHNAQVRGVRARDVLTDTVREFRAPVVVNAAGPWCRELAQKFDRDYPALFRRRLLLFNVLFKRKALSEYALALVPPQRPGHTYFVHNWKGRMLAGTGEVLLRRQRQPAAPAGAYRRLPRRHERRRPRTHPEREGHRARLLRASCRPRRRAARPAAR